jgi:4-amino-4-deoxy-L-arabinose transferase-like glycosyltransferase
LALQALRKSLLTSELGPLALLIAVNPVVYSINRSAAYFPPDSILYAVMARDFLDGLPLHVSGWGGAGGGVILPPLYPAVVALMSIASPNRLAVAEYVSAISIILAAIPLYLTARSYAGRIPSLIGVGALQCMGFYFHTALQPLTEGLFILVSAIAAYVLVRTARRGTKLRWVLISGVCAALVYFTRQIGLLFLPCAVLFFLLPGTESFRSRVKRRVTAAVVVVGGFLVLAGPYALTLYLQTGQLPLKQRFSTRSQAVQPSAEDLRTIERIRAETSAGYEGTYGERRRLRKLNEARSAMLSSVVAGDGNQRSLVSSVFKTLMSPRSVIQRIGSNLRHVVTAAGPGLSLLFCMAMLFPLTRTTDERRRWVWSVPWLWVVGYVFGLSLVSTTVDRYVLVIIPFLFLQSVLFLTTVGGWLPAVRTRHGRLPIDGGLATIVFVIGLASAPSLFADVSRYPKLLESELPMGALRNVVGRGDPMFTLYPADAYFLGGIFRVQPDARTGDLAAFARRTGVKWLVVRRTPQIMQELQYYSESSWYLDPGVVSDTNLVFMGSSEDDVLHLYRVRDQ